MASLTLATEKTPPPGAPRFFQKHMSDSLTSAHASRGILTAAAALCAVGGYAADWNRTHLFNPKWPPHAKYHDAMTILLGTLLGGGALFFLWRRPRPSREDLALGALLPAAFFFAQAGSFAFPQTGGLEAEFPEKVPEIGSVRLNEKPFALGMLALIAAGYALGRRALR